MACQYKTELIVLALDEKGIPRTSDGRLAIVRNLVEMTRKGGLPDEKLFVDPLVMAISTGIENGNVFLDDVPKDPRGVPAGSSHVRAFQYLLRDASSIHTEPSLCRARHTGGNGQCDRQP